ncbi:hypothetical protein pqer_cds_1089 [Pandoravirus quercus]|uniref:Uncharacterized protein n=2 Tax=Pandoravirus TaxID=2060084 RepID=A0A2U7UAN7_9VIRU|nr:hypothetical protein pqer_cds_1089 [Pandoravirus quercus]AVK75511.1 hypothetical protein pqer_cds_1089 [Pandoravirus quercus]QBZ81690.1 hypothetical protein pclt_cds_1107 [Pandoravirus celtis]
MGQANTTIKGYSAVSQDALFATYGITEGDYQAKASAAIERIRAMPEGYASPEDRAAAINAIRTGTCGDDTELLTRVRAALDRWQRDCASTGHALKSKVV